MELKDVIDRIDDLEIAVAEGQRRTRTTIEGFAERLLKLEAEAASVLKDGLGKVREAVTEFADTKADQIEREAQP